MKKWTSLPVILIDNMSSGIPLGHSECKTFGHTIQSTLLYYAQQNVLHFSIVHGVLKHLFYVSFWCVFLFKVHCVLTKISENEEKRWQHLGTLCFYEIKWQFRGKKNIYMSNCWYDVLIWSQKARKENTRLKRWKIHLLSLSLITNFGCW